MEREPDMTQHSTTEQDTARTVAEGVKSPGAVIERPTDDKGRIVVDALSDGEVIRETLLRMRALSDVLEVIGQNPMARAMMPPGMF